MNYVTTFFTLTPASFRALFPDVILLKTPRGTYLGRSLTLISFMSVSRDLTGARTPAKKNFFIIVSERTPRTSRRSIFGFANCFSNSDWLTKILLVVFCFWFQFDVHNFKFKSGTYSFFKLKRFRTITFIHSYTEPLNFPRLTKHAGIGWKTVVSQCPVENATLEISPFLSNVHTRSE